MSTVQRPLMRLLLAVAHITPRPSPALPASLEPFAQVSFTKHGTKVTDVHHLRLDLWACSIIIQYGALILGSLYAEHVQYKPYKSHKVPMVKIQETARGPH